MRTSPVLLTILSHHGTTPPDLPREPSYLGYFENYVGEQFVYVYERATDLATLFVGDAEWKAYTVLDGRVADFIFSRDERTWLRACWLASKGEP